MLQESSFGDLIDLRTKFVSKYLRIKCRVRSITRGSTFTQTSHHIKIIHVGDLRTAAKMISLWLFVLRPKI